MSTIFLPLHSPRRFQFSYDFILTILLEHPYLDQISFHLNSSVVDVPYNELDYIPTGGLFATTHRPTTASVREGSTTPPPVEVRMANQAYADYAAMADEIVARLSRRPAPMQSDVDAVVARAAAVAQAAAMAQVAGAAPAAPAAGPWTCPSCGGANNGKFCEYCGTPKP